MKLDSLLVGIHRFGTEIDFTIVNYVSNMVDISRAVTEIESRAKVFYYLIGAEWSTANETGDALGMSRQQADRLLRNLYEVGVAERRKRESSTPGRPEYEYKIKTPFEP